MASELNEIVREICEFLSENVVAEGVLVTEETVLAETGVDSYSIIEVLLFLERRFKIIVPEGDLTQENLRTVGTLARSAYNSPGGQG